MAIQRLSIEIVWCVFLSRCYVGFSFWATKNEENSKFSQLLSVSHTALSPCSKLTHTLACNSIEIHIYSVHTYIHIYIFGWLTNTLAQFNSEITILSVVCSLIIPLCDACLLAHCENMSWAHTLTHRRIHSNVQSNRRKRRTEESKRR